ncbi:50S ribosomal protein L29 [uncultured archaeon]|nr:50S ribosomal protein L29 [uncultured archaeon]
MYIKELREMSVEALQGKLQQLSIDLAVERRKIASTGVASKKLKSKDMRRARARILTILKEKGVTA